MRKFIVWVVFMGSLLVLGTVGYGEYLIRDEVPLPARIILWSITICFVIAPAALVVLVVKAILTPKTIHLGPHGAYDRLFLGYKALSPLDIQKQVEVSHVPATISRIAYVPAPEPEPGQEPEDAVFNEEMPPTGETDNVSVLYTELDRAVEAYNSGARSRAKLADALTISQHRAAQLIAQIEVTGRGKTKA